jgi:guanine deaminase
LTPSESSPDTYLREAIELARGGMQDGQGGPFGAVIVKQGRIVGRGSNRVVRSNDPTAHAEIVAIREACGALGTHVLAGCGAYATCEPCPMCLAALYWARVDRIYFGCTAGDARDAGFDDALICSELAKSPAERRLPMQQILRDEAVSLFDEWKANPGWVRY